MPFTGQHFPASARVRRPAEFERIWTRGGRERIGSLEARFEPDRRPRIGISIGRKVTGAAGRNRLKRWIREHYRQHPERFPEPLALVIVIRRPLAREPLIRDFERLWRRCATRTGSRDGPAPS